MSAEMKRLLLILGGAMLGLGLCYVLVDSLYLGPSERLDREIAQLGGDIQKLVIENRRGVGYERLMKQMKRASFGTDELDVREAARQRLSALLNRSGLTSQQYALKPWPGRRVAGVYQEVGWTVDARGDLPRIIDFLYLLRNDPYLHRIENISISPDLTAGVADLSLRYSTLILETRETRDVEPNQIPEDRLEVAMDDQSRDAYTVIAVRDLFRPYIKRRVVQAPPQPRPEPRTDQPRPEPRPQPAPGPTMAQRMQLVGLPQWNGVSEAVFRDKTSGQVMKFTAGEDVGDARFVSVDYRARPLPDDPTRLSPSRLLLKVGPDIWAVELGHTLAQRHRLKADDLPSELTAAGE